MSMQNQSMTNQKTKGITIADNKNTVKGLLHKMRDQMAMCLPKHLTPERITRLALTELSKTPKLAECDPLSFVACVMLCAQMGLEPGPLGHVFFVPYGNQCTFQLGYKGMIDLAKRSGQIISLSAHAVYDADKFDFAFGLNERLEHVPSLTERGNFKAVYAVAKLKDDGVQFDVLSPLDVEKARSCSKSKNSPAWLNFPDEMAKKTAIRRLFKYLPVSIEMQRAINFEDKIETTNAAQILKEESGIDFTGYTVDAEVESQTGEIRSQADELADQLAGKATSNETNQVNKNTNTQNHNSVSEQKAENGTEKLGQVDTNADAENKTSNAAGKAEAVSIDQLTMIRDLIAEKKIDAESKKKYLAPFQVTSIEKLTRTQADTFISQMEKS